MDTMQATVRTAAIVVMVHTAATVLTVHMAAIVVMVHTAATVLTVLVKEKIFLFNWF